MIQQSPISSGACKPTQIPKEYKQVKSLCWGSSSSLVQRAEESIFLPRQLPETRTPSVQGAEYSHILVILQGIWEGSC